MKTYLSPVRPHILAHRGLTADGKIDENTVESFRAALAVGATHLESDVRVTRDGVAVLFHDETLERMAGRGARVADLEFAELSTLSLINGGQIPSLEAALAAFPEVRFNLDIKTESGCAAATKAIDETEAWDRVLIASFSSGRVRRTASLLQKPASYSPGIGTVLAIYLCAGIRLRSVARLLARDFDVLQIPSRVRLFKFASARFINFAHSLGLLVHFWTINSPDEMQALVKLGADGVVTDRADIARKALKRPPFLGNS